jgi:glycosyltransferase involved in cell wall biosynthesis
MLKSREVPRTLLHPLAARLERALLRDSDLIVTNSRASRRDIVRLAGPRVAVAVCPPGRDAVVPQRPAPARAGGPPVVLAVGNLFRVKGQDLLVRALAAHADLDWRLRLAGDTTVDPAFTRRVLRLARRCGLGGRIELAGHLEGAALAAAYRDADLFVLSSRYEAYGIALAEALSFGVPFVAFDVGGVSEAAGREDLVPAGDVRALGARIAALLASPEARAAAARRARERAALLPSWAETGDCFALRLRELVAAKGAG